MAQIHKLFCFPYAGGNADSIYRIWRKFLHPEIQLLPVDYAGHGSRIAKPLGKSVKEVALDIFECFIRSNIEPESRYMMYGHSMGTLVIYEVMKLIHKGGYPLPHTVLLSGRYSPHIYYQKERLYLLPDKQFISRLVELGGVNSEIYKHEELMELYIPIIKNDYKLIESYQFSPPVQSFNSNLIILSGDNDPYTIDKDKLREWGVYTNHL